MTIPLVILAVLATVGEVIDLPFTNAKLNLLDRWLEPVLRGAPEIPEHSAPDSCSRRSRWHSPSPRSCSARAWYRNGLDAEAHDPTVERLGGFANVLENAYYLDVGLGPLRERPAHRVRALPE